jgi:hypothetical protein
MGARRPQTPAWSLRSRAPRKVGRPPRASAGDGFRLAAGGAQSRVVPPARPRAGAVGRLRLLRHLRGALGAPALPSAPQGAPCRQTGPARRGESIAAGRASSGQGQALRCAPGGLRPALTAPALPLRGSLPLGRKMAGGSCLGERRWRSRWSRRVFLLARSQAAGLHHHGAAGAVPARA